MSHITEIEPETADQGITSLFALEQAAKHFGLQLNRGQTSFRSWASDHGGNLVGDYPLPAGRTKADIGKCLHAIVDPTATNKTGSENYEIGVVASQKFPKTFSLMFDFWGGHMSQKIGKDCGKLMQRYQAEVAKLNAQKIDGNYSETVDQEGNILVDVDTTARMGY